MDKAQLLIQLDSVLADFEELRHKAKFSDMSDLTDTVRQSVQTRALAAIQRVAGPKSSYSDQVDRVLRRPNLHETLPSILGVLHALREDVSNGFVVSVVELAHAELFSDFLEMADELLSSGYKDPAAVIAGTAIESHLRNLSSKQQLPITEADAKGKQKPIAADRMNAELAKANIYSKLDQKNVTAWLDLRNKAAHGHYSEYNIEQVKLMILGSREFIGRIPG